MCVVDTLLLVTLGIWLVWGATLKKQGLTQRRVWGYLPLTNHKALWKSDLHNKAQSKCLEMLSESDFPAVRKIKVDSCFQKVNLK